jgi:hypothetical protein
MVLDFSAVFNYFNTRNEKFRLEMLLSYASSLVFCQCHLNDSYHVYNHHHLQ